MFFEKKHGKVLEFPKITVPLHSLLRITPNKCNMRDCLLRNPSSWVCSCRSLSKKAFDL